MNSKIGWRTAAILGSLAVIGYAGAVLIGTTPSDTTTQVQMRMPGMEHEAEAPNRQSTEPSAEMEHEPGEQETGGHDISPVDVSGAPLARSDARGISCSSPGCTTASSSLR